MGKLLRARDILLLTLAGIGDIAQEIKDPMQIMGKSYENMYGFIPKRYKRSNFFQTVRRNLKTGNIERITKDGKAYLRLTSAGKNSLVRDFPILNLTKKWDKKWVIVVFDIEEKTKSVRNNLRNKLKSLGFGMLQKSIWISPLSIREDMKEFIHSIGLSENVFVMEIAGFLLGDPKELASKIWDLDKLEEEYFDLKTKLETSNQLVKKERDRIIKSEAGVKKVHGSNDEAVSEEKYDTDKGYSLDNIDKSYLYSLERQKRKIMREWLEFYITLPALPRELLPKSFVFVRKIQHLTINN